MYSVYIPGLQIWFRKKGVEFSQSVSPSPWAPISGDVPSTGASNFDIFKNSSGAPVGETNGCSGARHKSGDAG